MVLPLRRLVSVALVVALAADTVAIHQGPRRAVLVCLAILCSLGLLLTPIVFAFMRIFILRFFLLGFVVLGLVGLRHVAECG